MLTLVNFEAVVLYIFVLMVWVLLEIMENVFVCYLHVHYSLEISQLTHTLNHGYCLGILLSKTTRVIPCITVMKTILFENMRETWKHKLWNRDITSQILPNRYLRCHGFKSYQGLRFFLCPMLVINEHFIFIIYSPSWKFTIFHYLSHTWRFRACWS